MRLAVPFLLLALLLPAGARAAATLCTPAVVGDVHIQEETAGFVVDVAYPALCQPDATRMLRDHVTRALSDFKLEFPDHDLSEFPHKYEMIVQCRTWTAAGGRLASIKLHTMVYTGGAHPNNWPETWVFDMTSGHRLGLADVFAAPAEALAEITPLVRAELRTELDRMALDDMLLPGSAPTADNYADFIVTDEGVTFFFAPYQVAPYAAGEQTMTVPWDGLAPLLSPAFRKMLQ